MLKLPFLNKKFPKFKPKKWKKILNFEKFQQLKDKEQIENQIIFFLDLIDKTLVYHPDNRLTIQEVMQHPFVTLNVY
jgi:serine/threonine protein kinase